MARFADALNRTMDTIKRPPPPPLGHYLMQVTKVPSAPEAMNSAKFTGSKLTINVRIVAPLDDVNPDDLAEFGNVVGVPLRLDFIFNEDPEEEAKFEATANRLKEFARKCGVPDVDSPTKRLLETISELANTQFIGQLTHRQDPNDPMISYPEIGATTAA
jgi:hypothetical protein